MEQFAEKEFWENYRQRRRKTRRKEILFRLSRQVKGNCNHNLTYDGPIRHCWLERWFFRTNSAQESLLLYLEPRITFLQPQSKQRSEESAPISGFLCVPKYMPRDTWIHIHAMYIWGSSFRCSIRIHKSSLNVVYAADCLQFCRTPVRRLRCSLQSYDAWSRKYRYQFDAAE